jgi:hypothetical protein
MVENFFLRDSAIAQSMRVRQEMSFREGDDAIER